MKLALLGAPLSGWNWIPDGLNVRAVDWIRKITLIKTEVM